MILDAQAKGMDWSAMRENAHKNADALGAEIAAVITTPNVRVEGELDRLLVRATEMRAEYSTFVNLWYAATEEESDRQAKP